MYHQLLSLWNSDVKKQVTSRVNLKFSDGPSYNPDLSASDYHLGFIDDKKLSSREKIGNIEVFVREAS